MSDTMSPGGYLTPGGQMMTSIAPGVDKYIFTLEFDGNLVLYKQSGFWPVKREPLWASQTVGFETDKLTLQEDGNLVLYARNGKPIWASNVSGFQPRSLDLQDDGNVVIYDIQDLPRWATNTAGR